MTIKTPEQIALQVFADNGTNWVAQSPLDAMVAAIEADRAQRINKADAEVLFDVAESGIARELNAVDVRHHYSEGEMDRMTSRWRGARAAIAQIREVLT